MADGVGLVYTGEQPEKNFIIYEYLALDGIFS